MSIETPAAPPSLAAPSTVTDSAPDQAPEQDFAEDSLVEEVSIDGMCGVY